MLKKWSPQNKVCSAATKGISIGVKVYDSKYKDREQGKLSEPELTDKVWKLEIKCK